MKPEFGVIERLQIWWTNRSIKRLVRDFPERFRLTGERDEDGLLVYERTAWWAFRRGMND